MLTKVREMLALGLKLVRYEYRDIDTRHTWQAVRMMQSLIWVIMMGTSMARRATE